MDNNLHYFETLHADPGPADNPGRGTHCSIFRGISWFNGYLEQIREPLYHDLCVLFDEDHDTRIMPVIEGMYVDGLLAPVLFIGERKGSLAILVSDRCDERILTRILHGTQDVVGVHFDPWPVTVHRVSDDDTGIINASNESVQDYLRSIQSKWDLGLKRISRPVRQMDVDE